MLRSILFTLWFFAPAGIANAVPIFAAKTPGLKKWQTPLDFGKLWQGEPMLGRNKTWRGLVTGMIAATMVLWLQQFAVAHYAWAQELTAQVDYQALPLLILGPLLGFGALAGDALESFFKRRAGVPAGHSWFPYDQLDYIIGGALVALPFVRLTLGQYIWLIILWLVIHVVVSYIGYLLKFKERPI